MADDSHLLSTLFSYPSGYLLRWGIVTRIIKEMTLMSISTYHTPLNKLMDQSMKIESSFIPANYHWIFFATT